jgi:HEAT repeat protein/ElaB/YqjD/DUF883 family membrane-anchored ribosome-binding protein
MVRYTVAEVLGKIGNKVAIPALYQALKDADSDVRVRAASALGQIGSEKAIPHLLQSLMKDVDGRVRWSSVRGLEKIGSEAVIPTLCLALIDKDIDVRHEAVMALGSIGSETAIPNLLQALKEDANFDVRGCAANALSKIGSKAVTLDLCQVLTNKDEDSWVRCNAADALGQIGSESAVRTLWQASQDANRNIRETALKALGTIGSPVILPPLIQNFQQGEIYLLEVITSIQKHCKYYSYAIATSPPVEEENQSDPLVDTLNKLNRTMSETPKYDFRGSNIGNFADTVQSGGRQQAVQHIYAPEQKQNLIEAAKEIQQLLDQLSQTYPTTTESQKQAVVNQAIARIKRNNPTTWQRLRSATEAALIEAFKEVLDNPFVNITVAAVEGYRDAQ